MVGAAAFFAGDLSSQTVEPVLGQSGEVRFFLGALGLAGVFEIKDIFQDIRRGEHTKETLCQGFR